LKCRFCWHGAFYLFIKAFISMLLGFKHFFYGS
jgi:hypothetical protein